MVSSISEINSGLEFRKQTRKERRERKFPDGVGASAGAGKNRKAFGYSGIKYIKQSWCQVVRPSSFSQIISQHCDFIHFLDCVVQLNLKEYQRVGLRL